MDSSLLCLDSKLFYERLRASLVPHGHGGGTAPGLQSNSRGHGEQCDYTDISNFGYSADSKPAA